MILAALLSCTAQALSTCKPYLVPDAIMSTVSAAPGLSAVLHLNPGYLRGDFDGDGRPDYIVLAKSKAGDVLLVVCWASGSFEAVSPRQIVGGPPGMSFDFDGWKVIDTQERVYSAFGDFWPNKLADSVLLIWEDRGGGFLYRSAGSWHWDDGVDES